MTSCVSGLHIRCDGSGTYSSAEVRGIAGDGTDRDTGASRGGGAGEVARRTRGDAGAFTFAARSRTYDSDVADSTGPVMPRPSAGLGPLGEVSRLRPFERTVMPDVTGKIGAAMPRPSPAVAAGVVSRRLALGGGIVGAVDW